MTEREAPSRDLGELLEGLRVRHFQFEPTPLNYVAGMLDGTGLARFAILHDDLSNTEGNEQFASDEVNPDQVNESKWGTIPWSPPSSAYDPNDAFDEFRTSLVTRAPEDVDDLLTLFCASQYVRMNLGHISKIDDLSIFVWSVLINAPVVAGRRPLAWIERELESIVAVMLRHGA
ncbi:hypothetical protein [Rhizobium laguerreae]|uniref:hypothetical protein n=1 Tax=Rhizobium laguerreae TaxID=1076926 RepID=UPI001C90DE5B|nr:hypothetical protein [Rhizobium laguerreae]MBY3369067.1 hypothetical protein [Rhizobium laguerreae]